MGFITLKMILLCCQTMFLGPQLKTILKGHGGPHDCPHPIDPGFQQSLAAVTWLSSAFLNQSDQTVRLWSESS